MANPRAKISAEGFDDKPFTQHPRLSRGKQDECAAVNKAIGALFPRAIAPRGIPVVGDAHCSGFDTAPCHGCHAQLSCHNKGDEVSQPRRRPLNHEVLRKPSKCLPVTYSSVASPPPSAVATNEPPKTPAGQKKGEEDEGIDRMPRSIEAFWLKPLRREVEYGVPMCDLQLRSYSARNLEFFCDFALRAAYYLGLPAFGPVPLPRKIQRWTVPRSVFVHKKSQENFERITLRRLIQIRDGHPETVQLWLAFLQKHAYYGVGMKANVWEFSKLDVAKEMDAAVQETEKLLEDKWEHLGYLQRKPEFSPKGKEVVEKLPKPEEIEEFLATERRKVSGGR